MVKRLTPLLLALILGGCQGSTRTFTGFTFGGGGHTFSCEPASWTADTQGFQLVSGGDGATSITLKGRSALRRGEPTELSQAVIRVPTQGEEAAQLLNGHLVLQSEEGEIVHGSFDLKAKMTDGREFPVVGSFTAERRSP